MDETNFRIAVTGATGYLGSRLCRNFKDSAACTYQLTSNPGNASVALPSDRFTLTEGVRKGFFSENKIEALVHAAYDFRPKTRNDIWNSNVRGSIALFKQAREEGVKRIVFVSTMSAYEGCVSLYGQAKLEIEAALRESGVGCSVRPGLIYSTPLSDSGGMIGSILSRVQRGGVLPLIGGGKQQLYCVHEKDLARFIYWLAAPEINRDSLQLNEDCFIAANPRPYSLRSIIELVLHAEKKKKVSLVPVPWQIAWLGLKGLEVLGVNGDFRSDSVVSLAYQQKQPDFSTVPREFVFRDFADAIHV